MLLALSAPALLLPTTPSFSRPAVGRASLLTMQVDAPTAPKTVGDAKTAFQASYGNRPVGMMLQSFVNELLSSNVLAMASPTFKYNRVFALGFTTLCDTFLDTAANDAELRKSLCDGLGLDAARIERDAADLKAAAAAAGSEEALLASADFAELANAASPPKYTYTFGAGLLAMMPLVDVEVNDASIEKWSAALKMSPNRLSKDWKFFESSQEKMAEGKQMMMEMAASAKRKEAAKLKEDAEKAAKEAAAAECDAGDEAKCEDDTPAAPPPPPAAPPPPPAPVAAAPAPPPAGKEVKPFEEKKSAVDLMPKLPELPEIPNPFGGLFGGDKKD